MVLLAQPSACHQAMNTERALGLPAARQSANRQSLFQCRFCGAEVGGMSPQAMKDARTCRRALGKVANPRRSAPLELMEGPKGICRLCAVANLYGCCLIPSGRESRVLCRLVPCPSVPVSCSRACMGPRYEV
eukprot:4573183-Amphidinium_carterae.1